jgi:hypothetical protein
MSMRGTETDQPALQEAKQGAEAVIARFQDPVGLWRNDQQEIEIVHTPDGKFRVKEHLPAGQAFCAQTCFSITFEKVTPQTYEGSGLNTDTVCVFDFSYDLTFSDAATQLSLIGKHVRYRGPDPVFGSPDLNAIRARNKMCAAMVSNGLLSTNKEMAFERIR